MRKIKTKSAKYPLIIEFDGHRIRIPKQSKFDNRFLREHGCSLMAEYCALQYVGIHKWPIRLLQWHRKHTPKDIRAKVTLCGVAKGIAKIGKKRCTVKFYEEVTADRIREAMREGACVIMEQGSPIHSICLVPDKNKHGYSIFRISYGKVHGVTAGGMADTATSNKVYRGMIVVKEKDQ